MNDVARGTAVAALAAVVLLLIIPVAAPDGPAAEDLVSTGAPIARGLAVGVATILLGAVAVGLVRRRQRVRNRAARKLQAAGVGLGRGETGAGSRGRQ